MPSLNELKRKIKSIKSTQQITKAMKMIAGARLAHAQKNLNDSRCFADNAWRLVVQAAGSRQLDFNDPLTQRLYSHPYIRGAASDKLCLLVVTSDKGLCAGFNSNVLRKASQFLEENSDKQVSIFTVGKKAHDYFLRRGVKTSGEYLNLSGKLDFQTAELMAVELSWYYLYSRARQLTVIYNEFKSIIRQQVVSRTLLPFDLPAAHKESAYSCLYEPERGKLATLLFQKYVSCLLYSILVESYVAELAARMTAMDQATKNAHELIESLTLEMNKVRQAKITLELADIVGTSEVLR